MAPYRKSRLSGVVLLAGVTIVFSACSGDVLGNVYVTMKSGDVKRGADVQVVLVREQFMTEWTKASAEFKSAYREADAAYKEARAQSDQAFEAHLSGIRSGFSNRQAYDEASQRATETARRADSVRDEWFKHTMKLVEWATVKVARTDVNGHYEFKGVPRAKYYIAAAHRVFDNDLFWLVPVEVHGSQTVDLSNSNASSWFDAIRN